MFISRRHVSAFSHVEKGVSRGLLIVEKKEHASLEKITEEGAWAAWGWTSEGVGS